MQLKIIYRLIRNDNFWVVSHHSGNWVECASASCTCLISTSHSQANQDYYALLDLYSAHTLGLSNTYSSHNHYSTPRYKLHGDWKTVVLGILLMSQSLSTSMRHKKRVIEYSQFTLIHAGTNTTRSILKSVVNPQLSRYLTVEWLNDCYLEHCWLKGT